MVAQDGVPKWYERIRELEETRDEWVLRSVLALDFSEGAGTYFENSTFDLDPSVLRRIFSVQSGEKESDTQLSGERGSAAQLSGEKESDTQLSGERGSAAQLSGEKESATRPTDWYYIPLTWRKRESFLEFDCETNSGVSLQLVPLVQRQKYCLWLFWKCCRELGLIGDDYKVPSCIEECLRQHIETGAYSDARFYPCAGNVQEVWDRIVDNPEIRRIYDTLGRFQPLILRARDGEDVSIVKVRERKAVIKPGVIAIGDMLNGVCLGALRTRSASCTKIRAPKDMRISRVDAYFIFLEGGKERTVVVDPNELRMEIYGDGSWAFSPLKAYSSTIYWLVSFSSKESYFASPAIRTALLSLLTTTFWLATDFGKSSVGGASVTGVVNSFSMAVIASYFIYQLRLFSQQSERSLQFQWALKWQRYALMATMVMTVCFPFVNRLFSRVSDFVQVVTGFVPVLSGPVAHLTGLLTSSAFHLTVKWLIVFLIASFMWSFRRVSKFSRVKR